MSKPTDTWPEQRRRVVEAVASGRMSGREVMAELGIGAATLAGWVSAEKRLRRRRAAGRRSFVAVDVRHDADASRLVVEVGNGIRVRLGSGFDAAEVARLVRALASPC